MKQHGFRGLFLFAFILAFSVLLVSGAPRLIANERATEPDLCVRVVPAVFCSAPASVQQTAGAEHNLRQKLRCEETACVSGRVPQRFARMPFADANGNVVVERSYMRSVYQSFALGDGFA